MNGSLGEDFHDGVQVGEGDEGIECAMFGHLDGHRPFVFLIVSPHYQVHGFKVDFEIYDISFVYLIRLHNPTSTKLWFTFSQ